MEDLKDTIAMKSSNRLIYGTVYDWADEFPNRFRASNLSDLEDALLELALEGVLNPYQDQHGQTCYSSGHYQPLSI